MKIVALTTQHPGIRHLAHLWALKELPIDLVCVEVAGKGVLLEKVKRQLRLLRSKGPRKYIQWRRDRNSAAESRQQMSQLLSKRLAEEPFARFTPSFARAFNGFSNALVKFIQEQKPDYVFQLGVGLLPAHFICRVPPILNMHPGILPGIRGLDPIFWAHYYAREDWFGTTLHIIDEGIDTGKPLLRRRFTPQKNAHFAESICQQVFLEMDMLRAFFLNPDSYDQFDMGGCEKSVYRSTWSHAQYQALEAARWWGPVEDKPTQSTEKVKTTPRFSWRPSKTSLLGVQK